MVFLFDYHFSLIATSSDLLVSLFRCLSFFMLLTLLSVWCGGGVWTLTTSPSPTWLPWGTCWALAFWPCASAVSHLFRAWVFEFLPSPWTPSQPLSCRTNLFSQKCFWLDNKAFSDLYHWASSYQGICHKFIPLHWWRDGTCDTHPFTPIHLGVRFAAWTSPAHSWTWFFYSRLKRSFSSIFQNICYTTLDWEIIPIHLCC